MFYSNARAHSSSCGVGFGGATRADLASQFSSAPRQCVYATFKPDLMINGGEGGTVSSALYNCSRCSKQNQKNHFF